MNAFERYLRWKSDTIMLDSQVDLAYREYRSLNKILEDCLEFYKANEDGLYFHLDGLWSDNFVFNYFTLGSNGRIDVYYTRPRDNDPMWFHMNEKFMDYEFRQAQWARAVRAQKAYPERRKEVAAEAARITEERERATLQALKKKYEGA